MTVPDAKRKTVKVQVRLRPDEHDALRKCAEKLELDMSRTVGLLAVVRLASFILVRSPA